MNRKVTLPLILFGSVVLAVFIFVKPVFAGCDQNQFSQNAAYAPPSDRPGVPGICGDSGGVADCCNTDPSVTARDHCPGSGARCWPPYTEMTNTSCQPGYIDPNDFFGLTGCNICCLPDPNPPIKGMRECKWRATPLGIRDCNYVQTNAADVTPKDYCKPPASRITVNGKLQCGNVTPSGWSNKVTDCRAQGPGVPATAGIQTAIGCIPTNDLVDTAGFVMRWVFGFAGGVILLMLIVTGYSLITSTGNPEKLQAVRENLVAIFSGIILIAFSLVLLKAIGANVLGLPGF